MTAMAFGPGGVLAVADAGNGLQLFDVASARHAAWSRPGGAGASLPARLAAMPGHISGISFNPHPKVRPVSLPVLLLYTSIQVQACLAAMLHASMCSVRDNHIT